ncbi:MAG: HIT family protein [Candidatus Buchananbacteria bacterium]|jgi:histidine triad (HIT) family protein
MDCIFCKIIAGEISSNKIYEDDKVVAFLDINPVNPGHVLVVPKAHYELMAQMQENALSAVVGAVNRVSQGVLKAVGADSFNLYLNNGKTAGQLVPHFHWHIIPRHSGDGLELWHGKAYGEGEAQIVAKKIKENLS